MKIITEILSDYYKKHDTRDLVLLFERYMKEIGAVKLDLRKKNNANTYRIDGNSTNWNRVECCYYRNNGDHRKYGMFEFCITFRKRSGDYFLIETGNNRCDIERPFEISCGEIIHYNGELMKELIKKHPKLFSLMYE